MSLKRTNTPESFGPGPSSGDVRSRILGAFAQLLQEPGYAKLRVKDILERADVGRTSFYAHFSSKEQLLKASLDRLKDALVKHSARDSAGEPLAFVGAFFRHIGSHRAIYDAVIGREDFPLFAHYMERMLVELVRESMTADSANNELAVRHMAGALWAVATWWIEQGGGLSAEDTAAMFHHLALYGLQAGPQKA